MILFLSYPWTILVRLRLRTIACARSLYMYHLSCIFAVMLYGRLVCAQSLRDLLGPRGPSSQQKYPVPRGAGQAGGNEQRSREHRVSEVEERGIKHAGANLRTVRRASLEDAPCQARMNIKAVPD